MNASPQDKQRLIDAALAVRQRAYAKYSGMLVGSAVLTVDGEVFAGCNVENSSFGLTICAERVAMSSAVSAGKQDFAMMAVATVDGHLPCGACRQFLAEFCDELPLLIVDADDPENVQEVRLSELLPGRFKL